jgi:hypothetical protein
MRQGPGMRYLTLTFVLFNCRVVQITQPQALGSIAEFFFFAQLRVSR